MNEFINLNEYVNQLKKRKKKSKIYQKHQLSGLIIANLLKDQKHKTLYIKLAKEINNEKLIELAKSIIENQKIKNPAAYFMWKIKQEGLIKKNKNSKSKNKKVVIQTLFGKKKKCIKI